MIGSPRPITSAAQAFLEGTGSDHRGRSIVHILAFDDESLEAVHDYIQWLFPLPERSRFSAEAPVLTAPEVAMIAASPLARRNLLAAAHRLQRFYESNGHWLTAINHNHLRITRIIRSLRILVGVEEAQAFRARIEDLVAAAGNPVAPEAINHWHRAAQDTL
ncbi:MAG: opioid growth factor receptor-related protein [Aestuariivirgaceae bacterium]